MFYKIKSNKYLKIGVMIAFDCFCHLTKVYAVNNSKNYGLDSNRIISIKQYTNMLVATPQISLNTNGVCLKYSGVFSLKRQLNTAFGFSLFIERLQLNKKKTIPTDISQIKLGYNILGATIINRFSKNFCIQGGLSFLIGKEEITRYYYKLTSTSNANTTYELRYKQERNNIFGIEVEQNIYYMTSRKDGFIIGIGIFERGLNSTIYDSDFGARFSIGLHF